MLLVTKLLGLVSPATSDLTAHEFLGLTSTVTSDPDTEICIIGKSVESLILSGLFLSSEGDSKILDTLLVWLFFAALAAEFCSHLLTANDNVAVVVTTLELFSVLGLLLPELEAEPDLEDDNDDGEKGLAVVSAADDFDVERRADDGKVDEDNELEVVELEASFRCAAACNEELTDDNILPVDDLPDSNNVESFSTDIANAPFGSETEVTVFVLLLFCTPATVDSALLLLLPSPAFPGSNFAFRS